MGRFVEVEAYEPQEEQRLQKTRFVEVPDPTRSTLLSVEKKDPDRYGKVLTLADKMGVPAPAIEDRFDAWDYMSGVAVYDDLQSTHPATSAILSDPDLAAVAKDDIEGLKRIEEKLGYARRPKATAWMDSDRLEGPDEEETPVRDWVRETFPDSYRAWMSGWVQEEMSRYGSQALVGRKPSDFDNRVPQLRQAFKDLNSRPIDGFFESGYLGAVQMLPQLLKQAEVRAWGAMAGGALGAAMTPYVGGTGLIPGMIAGQAASGLGYGFDLEGGLAYLDFLDLKDLEGNPLPDNVARVAAGAVGVVNAGIESAQFTGLAKLFPGVASKALVRESVGKAALALVSRYGKTVLTESAQETTQKLVNLVVEDIAKTISEKTGDQEFVHKTLQEVGQELSDEFIQSVATFGFLGVPGTVASIKPAVDAVETSKRNADFFDALNDSLDGSVTRGRYSPAIRSLVEQVKADALVAGDDIGQIGIPATALDTLFQSDPGGLQEFLQAAEVEPGAFSKALDQDGDVEIPLEVFAQKIAGTDVGRKLVNDLRLFPSDSTVNEAKRESEFLKTVLEQRATEGLRVMSEDADLKAEIERIKASGVRLEGMGDKEVDAQLSVLATRAKVAAEEWTRAGTPTTPGEWLRKIQVVRGGEPGLEALLQKSPSERVEIGEILPGDVSTPEFRTWFGDSKVVDESGNPLVVYHGTDKDFESFDPDMGYSATDRIGSWFSKNPDLANVRSEQVSKYHRSIKETGDARTIPSMLSLKNPLRVKSRQDLDLEVSRRMVVTGDALEIVKEIMREEYREAPEVYLGNHADLERYSEDVEARFRVNQDIMGPSFVDEIAPFVREALYEYDGAIIEDDKGHGTAYVAFSPTQVKSVFNRGTWDPNDPRILYQGANLAARFEQSSPVRISGNEIADLSGDYDLKAVRRAAKQWATKNGIVGDFQNVDTDWVVRVSRGGIKSALAHGAGPEKVQAIAALPELLKNGILIHSERNYKGKSLTSHIFASKLVLGDKEFVAGLVVHEDQNGKKFYDHEMSKIKSLDSATPQSGVPLEGEKPSAPNQGSVINIIRQELGIQSDIFLQESLRGAVTFTDTGPVINLFKSANYSTFLHEIGHVFIRDLENLVATGNASEQARQDLEALQRFVSDQPDRVAQQEKLARAFETYLLEGKAPTEELRSAFARFRGWLTAIYRSLKSVLGVEINDEIRGVFDRMLQAEEDIKAAETYHNVRSSMDALIDEVATDAEKTRIEKLKRKLNQDAVEKRTSTLLKAYMRAMAGPDGRRNRMKRAESEVMAQPVYAAIEDARQNGGLRVEDHEDPFIRRINTRHAGGVASSVGQLDPSLLAAKHGFNSTEEMFKAMADAESSKVAIVRRAKELLSKEEDVIRREMESEALSEQYGVTFPGDAEFHNEAALDVLLAEAEILRRKRAQQEKRKISVTRITAQALRDKVRADLGEKPVREALRYDRSSAAESRAARASETAFRKGDIEESLRQKQLQAYYHAMVLESVRSREEMAKFERKVSRFLRNMDSIENEHREQFLALANRYELTERSPKDPDRLKSFEAFVAEVANDDPNGVPMFSPWLLRGEKAGSYRGLTLDEARELRAAIDWVVGHGSDQLQQMLTMESISIATYADKAQRLAQGVKSKPIQSERTRFFDIRRKIRGGIAKISQIQFYLMAMDNYQNQDGTDPGLNEQMFRWLSDAGSREKKIYYEELWPEYEKAFKLIRAAQKRIEKKHGTYFDAPGVPVTPAMEKVGATSWTSERVIAAALNMGNEGNLAATLQGYGLSREQLDTLVSVLTEEDWKAIQGIWDLIDTQYAPMDEAYFKINNIHTKKVQATPFTVKTEDGKTLDIRGGYYPLIFDHKLSDRAEAFLAEDLLKNSEMAVTHSPAARSGFTNARTGGLMPPKLALGVIAQHLYDTVHYYTHAAVIRDMDRITRVPEWKEEFVRIHGREAYSEIRPWLKSVVRPERAITDVYDDFLTRQRMLASIAVLGLNVKSASKQFLDFFAAMRDLGPVYVGRGIFSSWGNWRESASEVRALSPYMANRKLAIDREMREVLTRTSPGKRTLTIHGDEYSWNDVEKFAFKFIEVADAAVTIPVWKAAYAKASDLRMPPEECIQYADNAVRVAQPGADLIDMVALQRSQNWTRLFSMFISPGLRVQNRMRYFWGAWRNGQMDTSSYFGHVLYELVAPSIARWAFYATFLGAMPWDDDDERAPVSDIFFNFLDQAIGGFPIVNTIPSMVEFGRGSPSPAMEGLTRVYSFAGSGLKAVRSIWDNDLSAEDEWIKFAAATADAVTFELGVGYVPRLLKTFAEGFEDLFVEERTVNPLRMIIKVPQKDRE
jgi:hypothetical protein